MGNAHVEACGALPASRIPLPPYQLAVVEHSPRPWRGALEAGLAKLLGAAVAWARADNALQTHGGNGNATEYEISRVLCDALILNIFEGAAEIQAQVFARRLLGE